MIYVIVKSFIASVIKYGNAMLVKGNKKRNNHFEGVVGKEKVKEYKGDTYF